MKYVRIVTFQIIAIVILSGCDTDSARAVPTPEEFCEHRGGVSFIEAHEDFNIIFCGNGEHIHVLLEEVL